MGQLYHALVADADPTNQSYEQILLALGYEMRVTPTEGEFFKALRTSTPDLILADVAFVRSGILSSIQQERPDWSPPIILLTSSDDADTAPHALDGAPIFACLNRPIKTADLAAAVTLAVRWSSQVRTLQQETQALRQALEDRKLIERAKGLLGHYCGLGEQDAYRHMQRYSSTRNQKLAEVAQAILAAGEVFEQLHAAVPLNVPTRGDGRHSPNGKNGAGLVANLEGTAPHDQGGGGKRQRHHEG